MSVQHKALMAIGLKEDQIDFDKVNDLESFVDDFLIDSDNWCGGKHIYGYVVCEADESQVVPCLTDGMFQKMADLELELENRLREYGLDKTLDDFNVYLISQVD